MRVLGIDPGSRFTGYGVIESTGRESRHVASGRINAESAPSFDDRLPLIYEGVERVVDRFSPDEVAIEGIFTAYNAQSTIKLGHARGVSVLAVRHREKPLADYAPADVKKTVAGHGRASKTEVERMVKMRLNLEGDLPQDAADALAVALCHTKQGMGHRE
ncbi:MAG: crossover junction endodeoxyribonuclease RuvC [Bradymonadaceae bacterium]